MKILILMPLDEKYVYYSLGLLKSVKEEVKDITYPMPAFIEYYVQTKKEDLLQATFNALVGMIDVYKEADEKKQDLIIIGNMPSEYKFDAVFNFQDEFEELEYEDLFVKKITDIISKSEKLEEDERTKLLSYLNMHTADESQMKLINIEATAKFISAYVKTDSNVDMDELIKIMRGDKDAVSNTK